MNRLRRSHSYRSNHQSLIDSWERHLRAERKSETTFANYMGGVRQFAEWLEQEACGDLLTVDRGTVETWIVALHQRLAPATVRTRYQAVRMFYDWLVFEEEIKRSPFGERLARRIKPPDVPETAKDVVTIEQLARVFGNLDKGKRWRDAVIISVLYDTGIRASELANCLAIHVDLDAGTILLPETKGKRPRLVGISPPSIRYIDRYWRLDVKRGGRKDDRYLVNGIFGRMTRDGVSGIVEKCFREIGITETIISAHDLRHSGASHIAADRSMTETELMDLYGWRSGEMVRRYTAQARQQAALAAHRVASPMMRVDEARRRK